MSPSLFTNILAYFSPQTLETVVSPINGRIKVDTFAGTTRIIVAGYTQSGGLIRELWTKTIHRLSQIHTHFKPKKVLILGFAGGTVAEYIKQRWPQVEFTVVDIDPVIVELGKKYFQTEQYQPIHFTIADAFSWIPQNKDTFDLIIIDLFIGKTHPEKLSRPKFISALYDSLSPHGVAVFNLFIDTVNDKILQATQHQISLRFPRLDPVRLFGNRLIIAAK